jgi:hypothetical protein
MVITRRDRISEAHNLHHAYPFVSGDTGRDAGRRIRATQLHRPASSSSRRARRDPTPGYFVPGTCCCSRRGVVMAESNSTSRARSNSPGDRNVTKKAHYLSEKIPFRYSAGGAPGDRRVTRKTLSPREKITFRQLARIAYPKKTSSALADETGRHVRTTKRWLAGKARPSIADRVVIGEIIRRLD